MGSTGGEKHGELYASLVRKGVSRRDFMKFCTAMAATLALPAGFGSTIAEALEKADKPVLVWLEFQDCAGNTESFLRADHPTIAELVLDIVSLDYHETIMAPAGFQAEKSLEDVVKNQKGKYLVVVEGSIPTGDGGVYCTVGGRAAVDIVKEVCGNALATIAVGACAWDGGWPAAQPNPTGARGVKDVVKGITLINLPGCPANVENITGTVVHYLTFGSFPVTDSMGRPYFAYREIIHDHCERRAHYDAGQFVRQWGDEGHRLGWCLYEMGCKGPETRKNCPQIRWNGGTNWPVRSGHGCIGCAAPHFWDTMSPFYRRLPKVPGFGIQSTADRIGVGVAAVTAGALATHGVVRAVRGKKTEPEKTEE
ncbi:MAG: hydrogenase small subunit [Nitrospirota bacterium]|jgi:hydrogenase small subunit